MNDAMMNNGATLQALTTERETVLRLATRKLPSGMAGSSARLLVLDVI